MMSVKTSFSLCLTAILLLSGCNYEQRSSSDAAKIADEMKSRQIKRITDSDVMLIAGDWGSAIAQQAEQILIAQLQENPSNIADVCQLKNIFAIDSLAQNYGIIIGLLTSKDLQNKTLDPKELEILAAYIYNAEKKLLQSSNLQRLGDSVLVYNAPIDTGSIICKRCLEGESRLPLALWRIKFNKRELVRRVEFKSLLKKRNTKK
jgi:hypothetical protein